MLCFTVHMFISPLVSHAYVHVCTIALAMRMCTQNVATPTIVLNFREENFRDRTQITKFTKILCHENLELYGI